ncbi:hypothetical protein DV738_g2217, partial [Chaetothyriales sp. CBS 135597]
MAEEKSKFLEGNEMELGERQGRFSPPRQPSSPIRRPGAGDWQNNPILPVVCYCASSIMMTVANKYILSFPDYNLNFLLLAVQSIVCVVAITGCKQGGLITFRDFKVEEAKKWFPISLLLIGMIYTSTKALRFLSIPVYTIFKNLTIILIAYGEVLWFGGSVSSMALFSFGLMVLSSVVAAWADVKHALESHGSSTGASDQLATLNAGYIWMLVNCLSSAAYLLCMRKRIKLTNFKDFDTMFYNNLLTIPILLVSSFIVEDWSSTNLAKNFPPQVRNAIIGAMIFTGLASIFISYTSAWCVRATSSTTYSMVGALNKLPIAVSGLIFFDAPVTIPSVTAIFIGFVSGIVYAVAKVNEKAKPKSGILPTSGVVSASSRSSRDSLNSQPTKPVGKVPFVSADNVLLVGEGDFSFALSLVKQYEPASVIATCFDSEQDLRKKYPGVEETLAQIVEQDSDDLITFSTRHKQQHLRRIIHGIDATKLSTTHKKVLRLLGPFTKIVFNFPHVGGLSTDVNRQVRSNQQLLVGFFNNEDTIIVPKGQILVTLFEGEPYTLWNIRDLARHCGLQVVESFKFPWSAYHGYRHARTLGSASSSISIF